MKTRIIEYIVSPAERHAAVGSRSFLIGLLILALSWSLVTPFSVRAERVHRARPTLSTPSRSQSTETFTVYGPQRFTRHPGAPVNVVQNFSLPADAVAPFAIRLENGSATGSNRVSSATIKLNGTSVYGPNDFDQNVSSLNGPVTLAATNTLEVKLSSAPGSYLTITFTATHTATQPTLDSVTPARTTQGQTVNVTLHGTNTHWTTGQTRASFGGEIAVGGAASGEPGPVTIIDPTTAVAALVVSPTAALEPRTVRVVTTPAGGGPDESLSLTESFTVDAATPPGAASAKVSTIAGASGAAGFADGNGSQARFNRISGVAVGPDDSIYVADTENQRIRVVRQTGSGNSTTWTVSTLAGNGTPGFADGPGASAMFNNPNGVAVDAAGVVYVADTANNRIRRIGTDGAVSTVAGDGTPGLQNGSGSQARFNAPQGIAVDSQGNIYVADTGNAAVRKIDLGGTVTTLAGDGAVGSTDSPNARFDGVVGIAVEGQNVYVYLADTGNHRIRRLDVAGTVITISGAERGFKDGSASQARFAEPSGIALEADGKIIVADGVNSLIRLVDPVLAANSSNQAVSTLAGTGVRGSSDGNGDTARFFTPRGLAVSNSSAIIVADTGNQLLRRILLPPIIISIDPASARVGDTVTIHGARFDGRGVERNVVRFTRSGGGTTFGSVTQATRTALSVVVPSDAATGPVIVETEGGTATSPNDFVVSQNPAPAITDFNPKRGIVGTPVVLTGTNLKVDANDPSVTFAGSAGRLPALVTNASATQVQATVPNGAITGVIELTHAGGTTATATPFTVDTEQDFSVTVAPSTTTAVQGGSGTYVVYVTSTQSTFSQLASLTATGLPAGITATFDPAQITAGASATLTLKLSGTISPGSYPFTIRGVAPVGGNDLVRTAGATLNVMAGGQTTLSGRVLSTDNEPIVGATASLDGRTAMTDASGSFLLVGVTAGTNRPLMIDGRTANSPNKTYPVIIEPANIVAGQANVYPYTFYLPPIDTQNEVEVVPGQNTVASNPRVPGLSMTIPVGANLRNRDGSPVARVSITPLAIDRTPAPLPANVSTGLVYTSQPGGALSDVPMPVTYPNLLGTNPGTRVNLYAFNHDTVQWYVYGTGTVSSDGRTIAPDINPGTGQRYGLPDFSWHFPSAAGPGGNPGEPDDCPKNRGSNPVDFSTGMKIENATDISIGGSRGGLALSRTYTSDLGRGRVAGAFGVGWKDNYDVRLTGSFVVGGAGRVITPDEQTGQLFSYAQTDSSGALVFKTTAAVSRLGDVLRKLTDGTFEYRLASGNVIRFDASGRATAIADANGNTTTLAYTGANLTRVTDAVGRSLNFDYDPAGRRIRMTDPLGRQWQYSYDSLSRLATVTDPLSGVMRYAYDTLNQLTSVTDKRGNLIKQVTYNLNGRVTDQKFADGGIEHYDYTLAGAIISSTTITNTLGYQRTLRFNAVGYVTEAVDRLGQRSQINRDITTNTALSTTGPCGCAENTRQYDARGNVTTTTDRLGQQTKMEYDPVFNRLTKITDPLGRTLSFTYDTRGNLLTMTDALNQTTTNSYNSFGQLISVTDPLGHTQSTEYDAYGNVSAVIDALGNRITIEHDLVGRVTAQIDALGRRSTNEYDVLNQVISTTDPSGAVTRYFYDANSNLVKVTDALLHSWTGIYDAKNRVISTTDAVGRVTRTFYDKADEVTVSISPSGRTVRNTYDPRGHLLTMTDPLGNVVAYQTDNRGNLISITDQRGHVTTFLYDELFRSIGMRDSLGRLSSQSYDGADNVSETIDRLGRRVNFSYDAGNRPTRITYADAVVSYTYDAASRVTRINDTQSGAVDWSYDDADRLLSETTHNGTVSYSYNQANQLTSMRAADRSPVTYAYDTAGRLQTIAQGAEAFTYSYDVLSRPTTLQRPNGVQTSYSFDAVDRLQRLTHTNSFNQPIEDYQFAYNIDDEIESITSLASATQLPQANTVGTADAANRIAQFGEASYSFDERGMTTSKTDGQGTTTYQWDARGRLTQSTLPSGQTINYGYDATGRLASRATNGSSTSFLYHNLDVVLDRGSDGSQVDYLNGMALDDKLRQASNATGALYFLQDQLRSTIALTDSGGNVVERKQYEPFGESQSSALTRYTFTGRERDASTGLMYYRARWYDPKQGRFISEDPAGFAGGLNKYAYVGDNPVTKTDPIGLYEIDVHYYLTYYLAKKTGCFSEADAQDIANEDQKTDEDSSTSPAKGDTDQQRMQNRVFHALHPGAAEGVGSPLLWQGAMNETSGHKWIGRYMHYLQDTFSHAGYTDDVWGHAKGTHSVDKTASDPAKAQRMAAAVWQALIKYAKAKHCKCDPKWDDSMWPTLNDFINVATDNPKWSTIDATERALDNPGLGDPVALARKRRILGLNDRYTGQW
jgi:RHS repeat-associated protein